MIFIIDKLQGIPKWNHPRISLCSSNIIQQIKKTVKKKKKIIKKFEKENWKLKKNRRKKPRNSAMNIMENLNKLILYILWMMFIIVGTINTGKLHISNNI